MLSYNEILPGRFIVLDGQPYEVLTSHVFRKQQRKPVNTTKLRNLITGKVAERTFHVSDDAKEAELTRKNVVYIYRAKGECWFHEEGNPGARFPLSEEVVGDAIKYMKEKSTVEALVFNEEVIGIRLPIKIDLEVTEAPPGLKGDTASGGSKVVTLETGAAVNAPLFINAGDVVRINTETGAYVERVEKTK